MKVTCNRGALLEALNIASNLISTRTPKPAFYCVKLTAQKDGDQDRLIISATDGDISLRYTNNQVQVEQAGEILIPADNIRNITRESVDDTLAIEQEDEMAKISGQDSIFKVFTPNVDEYPPIAELTGEPDFQIPGGQLKQLIAQSSFAAAKESTRYAFSGVLLHVKGSNVEMVSTDGRRLAQVKGLLGKAVNKEKEGAKAIIPVKALQLIDKLIEDPAELVGFVVSDNQVMVHTSTVTLSSILVEGQFPPYEDVIPKDANKQMLAGTADFLSAVRRASLLTTEESRSVRMQFSADGLTLSSRSSEAGEATVRFTCKYEGEPLEIGFNPDYIVDVLKIVDTDEITFELSIANRPGLLKAGPNFLYVIMPVNLQ